MSAADAIRDEQTLDIFNQNIVAVDQLYADVWHIGVNLALRVGDLIAIEFANIDVENARIKVVEQKTGKVRNIKLNDKVLNIIKRRRESYPDDVYLFQPHRRNRQTNKPVSKSSVYKAFRKASINLSVQCTTHTMRKTRGYQLRRAGYDISVISKLLNHSDPRVTMRYIGIDQDDIDETYDLVI